MSEFIPVAQPNITKKEIDSVLEVLNSGMLAQGKYVKELEDNFSKFTGAKYAVAVNSGTAALHLALLALGVKPGDEVITTPFTFWATASAIMMCGAIPVFVDIDEETFNIDASLVKGMITDKTVGILPVHLYGQPADMDEINAIAKEYNLWVLEDACQAHGAIYHGENVGTLGEMAVFSFYPTKNMAVAGEGGIVVTDDEKLAHKVRMQRQHGMGQRYYHEMFGYNYRMSNVAAAMGIVQLERLKAMNAIREKNARILLYGLKNLDGIVLPSIKDNRTTSWHQFTIRVLNNKRDELTEYLKENNIGTGIFYPLLVTEQKAYVAWMKDHDSNIQSVDGTPVALKVASEVLSIPVHSLLSAVDIERIIKTVRNFKEL